MLCSATSLKFYSWCWFYHCFFGVDSLPQQKGVLRLPVPSCLNVGFLGDYFGMGGGSYEDLNYMLHECREVSVLATSVYLSTSTGPGIWLMQGECCQKTGREERAADRLPGTDCKDAKVTFPP